MILWVAAVGALIGWIASDFSFGIIPGGMIGALMGLWLRAAVRGEIEAEIAHIAEAPEQIMRQRDVLLLAHPRGGRQFGRGEFEGRVAQLLLLGGQFEIHGLSFLLLRRAAP